MGTESDSMFNILLIGDSSVGKSSILHRFTDDSFDECYTSTTGVVDTKIRSVEMDGKTFKLQIWDTAGAGQERFQNIESSYYQEAHGVIIVYDVTKAETFKNVNQWFDVVDKHGNNNVCGLLVGNKCDLNKAVDTKTGKALADMLGFLFMETSAKVPIRVEQTFLIMVGEIKKKMWNLTSGNKNSADTINSSCSEEDDTKGEEGKIQGFFSTDEEEAGDIDVKLDGFCITKVISNEARVQVYGGRRIDSKEMVAIKVIKFEDQEITKHMVREMMIRDLKHQNLVGLKSTFLRNNGTQLCIEMEHLAMDLSQRMIIGPLEKTFFKQILEGVCYLHDQGIIHRDLKPANILVHEDKIGCPVVKITDFDLARAFVSAGKELTPYVGAAGFRAPEILLGSENYTSAVDMWAIGCIFAESETGKPFVAEGSDVSSLMEICRILGIPREEEWPGVSELPGYETFCLLAPQPHIGLRVHFPSVEATSFDLLTRMLTLEPNRRITAKAALAHDYFAGVQ